MLDCKGAVAVGIRAQSNNIGISDSAQNLTFAKCNIS